MSRPLRTVLNQANPNLIPSALQLLPAGDAFGLVQRSVRVAVVAHVAVLPDAAKASALVDVFVSAGGVDGQFTAVAPNSTPLTTECAINEDGDVLFLVADAVTEAEITYLSCEGDVFTDTLDVAANVGLLNSGRHARVILSAFDTSSGSPVALTVLARASTNPAAGNTKIDTTGASLRFEAAVTSATVTYVAFPESALADGLEGLVDF